MNEKRASEYAKKLSLLIREPTVSTYAQADKSSFYKLRELLKKMMPRLFSVCELEDFDGSMLLIWRGSDASKLPILLMNHQDVVEASGDWRYPPFSGEIAEGRIWGRGTLDTKGGLFAMLQGAEELISEGFTPTRDIYFISTCTEETDGSGAKAIAASLYDRGIRFYMILDEGGMIVEEPIAGATGSFALIGVGEKGSVNIKFTARSSGGHASTPKKNSPLVRLGAFMLDAERKKIFDVKICDTVKATLKVLSSSMRGPMKLALGHPTLFSPILKAVMPKASSSANAMLSTTLAFTVISASDGANVMPEEAYVIGNMRFSHHQGGEDSVAAITRLAKKHGLSVETLNEVLDTPISSHRSAQFKFLERSVTDSFRDVTVAPYIMNASSDSKYMSRLSEHSFRFAPFKISNEQLESVHGVNESLDVSSLPLAVDFYKLIIKCEL